MSSLTLFNGCSLQQLRGIEDGTIQVCVTSPPYYGLRNYNLPPSTFADGWVGQLGMEPTPEMFIEHLAEIFTEVFRVLRPDGTLWLNLGDSYSGSGRGGNPTEGSSTLQGGQDTQKASMVGRRMKRGALVGLGDRTLASGAIGKAWVPPPPGLKSKDLIGIPWMAAFALRKAGWYLRSDCIWKKPNPMPESVTDRPTKAHEYIFLLSKSERYYYDADAVAEAQEEGERARRLREQAQGLNTVYSLRRDQPHGQIAPGANGVARNVKARQELAVKGTRNRRTVWEAHEDEFLQFLKWKAEQRMEKSTVWEVSTQPFKDAHFATFPVDLIKPCILAGSRPGDSVLDPFGGSGTTGKVAIELGRRAVLIELNPDYCKLIRERCTTTGGLGI